MQKSNQIKYNPRVEDQVLLSYKAAYKYKNPFKGPYDIVQTCTNKTVTTIMGVVIDWVSTRHINFYKTEHADKQIHFISQNKGIYI